MLRARPPQKLVLLPGREPLPFRYQDGLVSGVLPRLDLHAALSAEF